MASVRESSQQDRRVYVGNLSYDVKWHHLKDFMRQGKTLPCVQLAEAVVKRFGCSGGGPVRRCTVASEWNVEGGRLCVMAGFLVYSGCWTLD